MDRFHVVQDEPSHGGKVKPMKPVGARASRPARLLLLACSVWLVGLGCYFIFIRPPLLPEDPRFMGAGLEQIQAAVPGLALWLKHVFTVMGGFMAAAGLMTAAVALAADLHRPAVAAAVALAGVAGVMLMSAVNFSLSSDYKWLLLVPALLWAAAAALAAAGIRRP
jgi:hypothetical protein